MSEPDQTGSVPSSWMRWLHTLVFLLTSCTPIGVLVWMRLKAGGDPEMAAGMVILAGYILMPLCIGGVGVGCWGMSIYRVANTSVMVRCLLIAGVVLAFLPATWVFLLKLMDSVGII